MNEITGVILAGGVSRRLGHRNKALLEILGKSVIQYVVEALSRVTENICLITNSPEEYAMLDLPMFGDILPGSGSVGGIYTGLRISETHHNLVIACDMPFVRPHLLSMLIDNSSDYDVVIPETKDGYHPTSAIYSKNCIEPIEALIKTDNLKIIDFFPNVAVNNMDIDVLIPDHDPNILFNINTNVDGSVHRNKIPSARLLLYTISATVC